EDLDDAGASHAAARLGLVEEALQGDLVLRDLRLHDLEGDVAIDELVLRRPHGAARPGAEPFDEAVARLDQVAGIQAHRGYEVRAPGSSAHGAAKNAAARRAGARTSRTGRASPLQRLRARPSRFSRPSDVVVEEELVGDGTKADLVE